MNRDIRIDDFGPANFQTGIPPQLSGYTIASAMGFHATGPWGIICLQEVKTDKFILRHFLFSLKTAIRFYIQERNEGIQSLISLKGEVSHSVNSLQPVRLKEKEFILFNAGEQQTSTNIDTGRVTSLLNTYYAPGYFKNLLPFFPALKKDIRKSKSKAVYFSFPPKHARYSVQDAITSIFFDRYLEHLQLKHVEMRIETSLFTLLAQTYTQEKTQYISSFEKEKAAAALEIILKDLRVHLPPEEIALRLHCSPGWLKKAFSKVYGVGMFHYLRKTRMQWAKEMLLNGESLKAVAIEVGMKPRNFPKEFKSFFGYTVTSLKKGQL